MSAKIDVKYFTEKYELGVSKLQVLGVKIYEKFLGLSTLRPWTLGCPVNFK